MKRERGVIGNRRAATQKKEIKKINVVDNLNKHGGHRDQYEL